MRHLLGTVVTCGLLVIATASPARADILFYFHAPGAVQPDENLLFNADGLVLSGLTEGNPTNTAAVLDITGQELLLANGGQARE